MVKINKIYFLLLFFFSITILNGEENYLNIDATFFEANEKKQLLYFKGSVKMTKNDDILECQSLVINTMPSKDDPKKQEPKDYTATGNVSFVMHTADNILKGKGDIVKYYPQKHQYEIIGNGYLEDVKSDKRIYANTIYVDEITGFTNIKGDKNKPIKFILKLDSINQ